MEAFLILQLTSACTTIMKVPSLLLVLASFASFALFALASAAELESKQVFHVTGPRALFDSFYGANKEHLDLWSSATHADGTIDADVYGAPSVVHRLLATHGRTLRSGEEPALRLLAAAADTRATAAQEKIEIAACHARTDGYLDHVGVANATFVSSAFHDCWRNSTQAFAYLDKLTALAPTFVTKIASIGQTFEGRDIPVYKLSTGASETKQGLVAQALIHAREWQTGGAVFYLIAGLVDALRAGDPRVTAMFASYDWYFVPILNIDGYDYTWTDGNRLWRKNRRTFRVDGRAYVGVDLNRNFGPQDFFDLDGDSKRPNTDIYPGTGVLSEPESAAIYGFLRALPTKLAGLLDIHMNSQAILRPFSNQVTEAPEPFQTKLTTLGDVIRVAIEADSNVPYRNIMGGTGSYLAYGTFKDAVFAEFDNAAAYTLELERADGDFISPQQAIRDVGSRTLAACVAFSEGVQAYWM